MLEGSQIGGTGGTGGTGGGVLTAPRPTRARAGGGAGFGGGARLLVGTRRRKEV